VSEGNAEIHLTNVSHRFGETFAVRDLTFSVAGGEIVALVGRTGAGKTTALNLIMGTLQAETGLVRVAGLDPSRDFEKLRGKLAVSFQSDRLLPWRTAKENIELGLQILSSRDRKPATVQWLGCRGSSSKGRV
jgi:NitT/TauT family transport system ATP-binding protein